MSPPFRAEHLGSLLRPEALVKLRYAVADGKAKAAELPKLEDEAIADIVKVQQDCGFKAIGDGEYRRQQFWGVYWETLEGMEELQTAALKGYDASQFRLYAPDVASFLEDKVIPNQVTVCTGKIRHSGVSSYTREFEYLKTLLPKEQHGNIKLTLASPSWYHLRYAPGRAYPSSVYANDEEYFADAAKAYRTELKLLYDMGCRNVQVDDPNLAYFCSTKMLEGWKADKTNDKTADEMFAAYIKYYNDCFQRPSDMHIAIHLCRGNYMGSRHFAEGAYDRIAKQLFQDLHVDTYMLEYDTERAGGFEPLQYLPKGKTAILGVVTSKFAELEDKAEMVKRVRAAADYVAKGTGQSHDEALKQLGVSPQCGFASHAEGNKLEHKDMVAKLKLVRAIADDVWGGEP